MCADWLTIPHSRPTLIAVRGLSPVHIRQARCAARSVWIAGAVPGLILFSKMMRPRKRRPDSTCSLSIKGEKRWVSGKATAPFESLRLQPSKAVDTLARQSDDTVTAFRVIGKEVVVVRRD